MSEYAPELAGNYDDDDARIIDEEVSPVSAPANIAVATVPAEKADPTPPAPNRLLTGFAQIDANTAFVPVMMLPPDPYRKHLRIKLTSTTSTDNIFIADDPDKLPRVAGAATTDVSGSSHRVYAGDVVILDDYTGALWRIGCNVATTAILSYAAVTK